MKFKAVLFDLDGTLLDTIRDLADSMNAVLSRLGFAVHDIAAYKLLVGDGVETLVRRALPEDRTGDRLVAECVGAMSAEYSRRWDKNTRPYDGVPSLLDALSARGVPMAVLSNKPQQFTQLCVSKLLGQWRFAAVQGVGPGIAPKPDPSTALCISRSLHVDPGSFLYVGDTNTDMQTAGAAGMYGVGVLWGFRQADELLACGARRLIRRPHEILDLLEQDGPGVG